MQNINLLIGTLVLLFGIPLGNFLSKITKDENKRGQSWFKLIGLIGLIGAIIGLVLGSDVLLFSFAFIAIVSSGSIEK